MSHSQPWSMRAFMMVWSAQVTSSIGSRLTTFGLAVWLFQRTGSVTPYGIVSAAAAIPLVLAGPVAGVLLDRKDRRLMMIAGHAGAGACSLTLALLYAFGALDLALIVPIVALSACFQAVQAPALAAAASMLVDARQIGRANGLVQLGISIATVVAPSVAGALVVTVGFGGILLIDATSFLAAMALLAAVRIPRPTRTAAGAAAAGSWRAEISFGARYILLDPALLRLLALAAALNFSFAVYQVALTPMVLAFADARVLGVVLSAGGVGMVMSSALATTSAGSRLSIRALLALTAVEGASLCVAGLRPSAWLAAIGAFGALSTLPLIVAGLQLIWQRRVPIDLQGRVFSIRWVISGAASPAAYSLAGPLTDRVFEPLLSAGGPLASTVGRLLGTGEGRGAALLLLAVGALTAGAAVAARRSRFLLTLEAGHPGSEPERS